jgi:ferredoxin/ribosomal protein L12E/L44/L45/RPP1/RPP2
MNSSKHDNRPADEAAPAAGGSENVDVIGLLRRFHYGEPGATGATQPPGDTVLPALLNPYRDASAIRYQYPIYLAPPGEAADSELARPLSEHLSETLKSMAPGEDASRVLKDNLPWLERYLRRKLVGSEPVDAPALMQEASAALQEHLALKGSNRESLQADLERLRSAIAPNSVCLGYGPGVSLHLMLHAIRHRQRQRREQFRGQIADHIRALRALLDVEKARAGESGSVGPGASYFDAGALSGMLENRTHGSVAMPPERRRRIEQALGILQGWQDHPVLVRFVGRLDEPGFVQLGDVDIIESDDPCVTAAEVFQREATAYAELFSAVRIASLEIDGRYDPEVHDSWFAGFDWQAFSEDEMQMVTRVVALVSADYLACDGLPAFSRLLGSRQPVHVLTWVRAYDNPGAKAGEGPFDSYRFELAYFGIGHRQVVVAQTSAARYQDLLSGFLTALDSNRGSLHLVNRGTQTSVKQPVLEPWFVASAALESRAHPFILVNPCAGDRAAERISFDGNPQPENDWPVEKLEYRGDDGQVAEMEVAFTFADYALLMPALHEHFRRVPAGFEADELVPVDRYLGMDEAVVGRLVPYVWGIDGQGILTRLAISRALVFACRDRLNYWRTLQELAGIHNFYVEQAIDRVIEEQRAAEEADRQELLKAHEEQLESVRAEAAEKVMGQLVDVLMGADLSDMVGSATAMASMPARATASPAAEARPADTGEQKAEKEPEPEPEEELSFDEPWLDTDLCTTCDECININKMMFAYNDNKQAYIRDAKAGTYADLVVAAETCPAKCIHPGKPLNPKEPGLDELVARAEPFN